MFRKAARPSKPWSRFWRKPGRAVAVLLCLAASVLSLAGSGKVRTALKLALLSPATQPAQSTPPLTKEYIYAGGRIVAIEETATRAPRAPYPNGAPHPIPGTVQAEDFDDGGEGVAYHDIDTHFSPAYRRSEHVWIENCANPDGNCNVGSTWNGEWLEYTVQVAAAGTYTLETLVASGNGGGGAFRFDLDGAPVTGTLIVPNTGGWQTYQSVTASVTLPAGQHVLRLSLLGNGPQGGAGNYNYFRLTSGAVGAPPTGFLATAQPGGGQVNLKWNSPASGGQVNHYEVERKVSLADAAPVSFNCAASPCPDPSVTAGSIYIYRVRAVFANGLSDFSNQDLAATTAFADDPLNPNSVRTPIRAKHFTELRDAINTLRTAVGLTILNWSEAAPQSGGSIRASHYNDLRAGLAEALGKLGLPGPLSAPTTRGNAVTFKPVQELRDLMR